MATRTIENCSVIKRAVAEGIGEPERYWNLNKCLGYCHADNDDEPIETCKKCKFYISFEQENEKMTNKKAYQHIKSRLDRYIQSIEDDDALHKALEALECFIPKPPKVERERLLSWFYCPRCNKIIASKDNAGFYLNANTLTHCSCSQLLDWRE